MFRARRVLAIGFIMIVGGVLLAVPASAAIPPTGVKLIWPNRSTGFCLGVRAGDVTNGTHIIVWRCNGNSDQTWTVEPLGPGTNGPFFTLRNGTNRNKCLSVAGFSIENNARLVIRDCTPNQTVDQWWTPIDSPTLAPCTIFKNTRSGKVMGVRAGSITEGAAVVLWTHLGHGDQEWCSAAAPPN
jgi:hypothetical protein